MRLPHDVMLRLWLYIRGWQSLMIGLMERERFFFSFLFLLLSQSQLGRVCFRMICFEYLVKGQHQTIACLNVGLSTDINRLSASRAAQRADYLFDADTRLRADDGQA